MCAAGTRAIRCRRLKRQRTGRRAAIRARIEHVFGAQEIAPGRPAVCATIGIVAGADQDRLAELSSTKRSPAWRRFERRRSSLVSKLASRLAAA